MTNKLIKKIQNEIMKFVPDKSNVPLSILLEDCCSELSRLVAEWIKENDSSLTLMILKGDNVCGTKKSHDIIAVINTDMAVSIIDPTIQQFFPKKKSILVSNYNDLEIALSKIKDLYGGQWMKSEKFAGLSKNEQKKYKNIINKNIKENIAASVHN